jgi:sulfonate transport system substrate-binding protein
MTAVSGLGRRALLAAPLVLAAGPPPVLRVGDQKGGVEALLKAAGLLSRLPFQVEFSQFGAAAPLLEALNAGAIDLAAAGDAPVTFALAAGVQARIVAATRGTGASTAILVPEASPIRQAADLRGHPVATNRGSIGHALLLALAARERWPAKDAAIANLMPSDARAAMASGAVAAWSTWNTYIAQARLIDGARVVVDGSGGLLTGLSFLVATPDAIERKRGPLQGFLQAVVVGRRWALDNPQPYARQLAVEIGTTEAVARLAFDTDLAVPVPIDDALVAGEQRTIDLYAGAGLIRTRVEAARVVDATFNAVLG